MPSSRRTPREALRYPGGHDLAALLADQRTWQRTLAGAGWAVPAWPRAYGGRALTAGQRQIWGGDGAGAVEFTSSCVLGIP